MTAESLGISYGSGDSVGFAIVVQDGGSQIVLKANSSSIYPYARYDERKSVIKRFANRIVNAINKGGAE